ncbi:Glutaredoxin-2 [Phytophthora nicotianae]|uniref:Glutaredoxin-2 n=1 Tax=Phytophthora nicotianae TaxID=4792 RepID=A0A0W8DLM8_PHYNI|nr:Glutaredoxin-2 [Phytophthora nicotianae]
MAVQTRFAGASPGLKNRDSNSPDEATFRQIPPSTLLLAKILPLWLYRTEDTSELSELSVRWNVEGGTNGGFSQGGGNSYASGPNSGYRGSNNKPAGDWPF